MLNSIVRGFGFTIGRRTADNMIDNLRQSSGEYKETPALSVKQIFKTIMWGFGNILLSLFIGGLISGFVGNQNAVIVGVIFWCFATFIIGKGYYDENKKIIQSVNNYNKVLQEKERLTKETEELYISEKITKREYEVLMRKINKM